MPKENPCQLTLQGLEFIHGQNIVHLDIKPYNILFSRSVHPEKLRLNFNHPKNWINSFFAVPMPILGWKSLTLVWLGGLTMKVALMSKNCRYCHCYHHNCNFHHYLQCVIQFIYICDILKTQGTVEFIAPELISCKTASTSSDMWSDLQYINTLQYINMYIYI